jgi:nucleoside-diphosphate-sugar epimerase
LPSTAQVVVFDRRLPDKPDQRVTYYQGSIERVEDLTRALKNVDTVIHCAGLLNSLDVTLDELFRVNVDGTKNVILACLSCGVKRLLSTSSVAAVLKRSEGSSHVQTGCEDEVTYPKDSADFFDDYGYSKCLMERLVLKANRPGILATCVLRPSILFGRYDQKLAERLLKGKDNFIVGDGMNAIDIVHVSDAASAFIKCEQAMRTEKNGQIAGRVFFIGSGRPTLTKDFFGWTEQKPIKVPLQLAKIAGILNVILWKAIKIAPFGGVYVNVQTMEQVAANFYFLVKSAYQAFEYQPKDPLEAKRLIIEGKLN